jgi:hypothetical protein
MDHHFAAEHHMVEQYLLNEMSPQLRDEFEDHYFGCQLCAAELRATSAFLDTARTELQKPESASASSNILAINSSSRFLHWKPAFAIMALAACLLVIVYQNAVVFPSLRSEVATLRAPEILPTVSLAAGNSRGGAAASTSTGKAEAVLLQFDIPGQERFSAYTCQLLSPQHQVLWTGKVSAEEAKDTVSLRVPIAPRATGDYSLVVKGNQTGDASQASTNLATYTFELNAGTVGSGQ